jgi:hypothetical protein
MSGGTDPVIEVAGLRKAFDGTDADPGRPAAHYLWQSAAWIAGILVVFSALAIAECHKA